MLKIIIPLLIGLALYACDLKNDVDKCSDLKEKWMPALDLKCAGSKDYAGCVAGKYWLIQCQNGCVTCI